MQQDKKEIKIQNNFNIQWIDREDRKKEEEKERIKPIWLDTLKDDLIVKYPNKCVIAKEMNNGSFYLFYLCEYEDFFELWQEQPEGTQFYHISNLNCKPMSLLIDIEANREENPELGSEQDFLNRLVYDVIVEKMKILLQRILSTPSLLEMKIKVEKKDFIVLTSCSDKKYSAHVIYSNPKVFFANSSHVREFIVDLYNECLPEHNPKKGVLIKIKKHGDIQSVIDFSINVNMRLYKSGKTNTPKRLFWEFDVNKQMRVLDEWKLDVLKKTMLTFIQVDRYLCIEYRAKTLAPDFFQVFGPTFLENVPLRCLKQPFKRKNQNFNNNSNNSNSNSNSGNSNKGGSYENVNNKTKSQMEPICLELSRLYYECLLNKHWRKMKTLVNKDVLLKNLKITTIRWNTDKSKILLAFKNTPCPLSLRYKGMDHTKQTSGGHCLYISLKHFCIYPSCKHGSCQQIDGWAHALDLSCENIEKIKVFI